jgi:hypothetical protein
VVECAELAALVAAALSNGRSSTQRARRDELRNALRAGSVRRR